MRRLRPNKAGRTVREVGALLSATRGEWSSVAVRLVVHPLRVLVNRVVSLGRSVPLSVRVEP